jgi:hypothetical protein
MIRTNYLRAVFFKSNSNNSHVFIHHKSNRLTLKYKAVSIGAGHMVHTVNVTLHPRCRADGDFVSCPAYVSGARRRFALCGNPLSFMGWRHRDDYCFKLGGSSSCPRFKPLQQVRFFLQGFHLTPLQSSAVGPGIFKTCNMEVGTVRPA